MKKGIIFSFVFLLFLIGSVNNASFSSGYQTNVSVLILPASVSLSIISPKNITYDFTLAASKTVLVNISSNGDSVWYDWNGTNITYTAPVYVEFNEGSNTLYAYANNSDGSFNSTSVTFSVVITTPGGGGPPKPKNVSVGMKIIVPPLISVKDVGEIEFQIHIKNTGDVTLNGISIEGYLIGDTQLTTIPVIFDKTFISSLKKGEQETIDVTTSVNPDMFIYEVVITARSADPAYNTYDKVFINYIGKNITYIEKTIVFAEELINQNEECADLVDMINDAKAKLEAGNLEAATNIAQTALERCQRAIERLETPQPAAPPQVAAKELEKYGPAVAALALSLIVAFILAKIAIPLGIKYYWALVVKYF